MNTKSLVFCHGGRIRDMLLWINALTFFGLILRHAYTKIPNEKKSNANRSAWLIWADMCEGLACSKHDRLMFRLVFVMAIATFGSSGLITYELFYFKHVFLLPDQPVGYVLIANNVRGFINCIVFSFMAYYFFRCC